MEFRGWSLGQCHTLVMGIKKYFKFSSSNFYDHNQIIKNIKKFKIFQSTCDVIIYQVYRTYTYSYSLYTCTVPVHVYRIRVPVHVHTCTWITSFLVYDLLDYVARTRTSIIRRPILMITPSGILQWPLHVQLSWFKSYMMYVRSLWITVAGAERSRWAELEWLHGHHRLCTVYGDVYVNQGEEYTVYYTFININVCTVPLMKIQLYVL